MEKYFAVQWQNPETMGWETCMAFDTNDNKVAAVFLEEDEACADLEDWRDSTGEIYRMIKVILQEVE